MKSIFSILILVSLIYLSSQHGFFDNPTTPTLEEQTNPTQVLNEDIVQEQVENLSKKSKKKKTHREEITGVTKQMLHLHKKVLYYCWAWGTDISLMLLRFSKIFNFSIILHELSMWGICIVSFFFEVIVIYQNWGELNINSLSDTTAFVHHVLGVIFMSLFAAQIIGGYFLKYYIKEKQKDYPKYLVISKYFHFFLGVTLYLVGKIEIITGLYASQWRKETPHDIVTEKAIHQYIKVFTVVLIRIAFEIFHALQFSWWLKFILIVKIQNDRLERFLKQKLTFQSKKNKDSLVKHQSYSEQTQALCQMINERKTPEEIFQNTKIVYCIFENQILDLSNFTHPAGTFMLKYLKGREIDKYIHGGYNLEGFPIIPINIHTKYTNVLINSKSIGIIQTQHADPIVRIEKEEKNTPEDIDIESESEQKPLLHTWNMNNKTYNWTVDSLKPINNSSQIYQLNLKNSDYKIKNTLKKNNWFGKCYKLRIKSCPHQRIYTQVLCMTPENQKITQNILKLAQSSIKNIKLPSISEDYTINSEIKEQSIELQQQNYQNPTTEATALQENGIQKQIEITENYDNSTEDSSIEEFSDVFPLIIKPYESSPKGLAYSIQKKYKEKQEKGQTLQIQLQGPYGLGMPFNTPTKGQFAFFSGGTGILTFLDLYEYLLKKSVSKLFKMSQKYEVFEQFLGKQYIEDIGIQECFEECKFYIYNSFRQEEDYVGKQIVEPLFELNKYHNLNIVEGFSQFSSQKPQNFQRFNKDFFAENQYLLDCDMIFICGTTEMIHNIRKGLQQAGYNSDKIIIV